MGMFLNLDQEGGKVWEGFLEKKNGLKWVLES